MQNLFQWYEDKRQFPSLVVAYQCPATHAVWNNGTNGENNIANFRLIVDEVCREHSIDPDRIYVAGVSSGATGCWEMLATYPNLFAASIIMASGKYSGGGLSRIVNIPIWAFHVLDDPDTSVAGVRATVSQLQALGGKVWLTETPGHSHDCWTLAADRFQAVQWLLSQQKGTSGPLPRHRNLAVTLQLWRQELAAYGPQNYLVVPALLIAGWWMWRRHLRLLRNRPAATGQCVADSAPHEGSIGTTTSRV